MTRLFGTDGVRGLANASLTAELALDLSVCAAHVLADRGEFEGHRPLAVVGRDTRISGQFLEAAVVAGLVLGEWTGADPDVIPPEEGANRAVFVRSRSSTSRTSTEGRIQRTRTGHRRAHVQPQAR